MSNDAGQSAAPTAAWTGSESEMAAVQSAARWLVAATAAVAAVLLAGVQFSALGRLAGEAATARLLVSVGASAVGLLAVGVLLVLSARVLIHPGWTLNRMVHVASQHPSAQGWGSYDWLRRELAGQRGLLVPTVELDVDQIYRHHRAVLVAWSELHEQGRTTLGNGFPVAPGTEREYRLDNTSDVDRLRARLEQVTATTTRLATTANLIAIRRRYRHLVYSLGGLGVVIVAAVVAFAAATDAPPPVTAPLPVRISFNPDPRLLDEEGFPGGCAARTIDATAVAGTLQEPVVVSANAPCPLNGQQLTPEVGTAVPAPVK